MLLWLDHRQETEGFRLVVEHPAHLAPDRVLKKLGAYHPGRVWIVQRCVVVDASIPVCHLPLLPVHIEKQPIGLEHGTAGQEIGVPDVTVHFLKRVRVDHKVEASKPPFVGKKIGRLDIGYGSSGRLPFWEACLGRRS